MFRRVCLPCTLLSTASVAFPGDVHRWRRQRDDTNECHPLIIVLPYLSGLRPTLGGIIFPDGGALQLTPLIRSHSAAVSRLAFAFTEKKTTGRQQTLQCFSPRNKSINTLPRKNKFATLCAWDLGNCPFPIPNPPEHVKRRKERKQKHKYSPKESCRVTTDNVHRVGVVYSASTHGFVNSEWRSQASRPARTRHGTLRHCCWGTKIEAGCVSP